MPKLNSQKAEAVSTATSAFPLIPEGLWPAKLLAVESRENRIPGKDGYWRWEFEIHYTDDEGVDRTGKQWENTSLAEAAAWRMKQAFDAFGVSTDTDTDDLCGKWCQAQIGQEVIGAGSRKGEMGNIIVKLLPLDDEAAEAVGVSADVPDFED